MCFIIFKFVNNLDNTAIKMKLLKALIVVLSLIDIGTSLPVTSKPIENTPEHLAWEAWIMIPPTQNKTRKITPKSIFILPNKTTAPQLNCPPGHVIENSKCIETVQIDPNQILLNHLANVLSNTTYDFDYDYSEYEEPHKLVSDTSNKVPDYNEGPLKIDLLDSSTIIHDSNRDSLDYSSSTEDDVNPRPFRYPDTTSTATLAPSTIKTTEFDYGIPDFFSQTATSSTTIRPATSVRSTTTTTTTTTNPTTTESTTTITTSHSPTKIFESSTTTSRPIYIPIDSLPITPPFPPLPFSKATTAPTTTPIPLISSPAGEITFSGKDSEGGEEYGITVEDGDEESTSPTEEGEDITTPTDFTSPDIEQEPIKDSLDLQPTGQTIQVKSDTILFPGNVPSNNQNGNIFTEYMSDITLPTSPSNLVSEKVNREVANKPHDFLPNKEFSATTGQVNRSPEPILDNIENNNRFVYHHLGTVSSSREPERLDSTKTSEVQEQLRIINKIVEENKKRSDHSANIRFPSDSFIQTDNLKADFIRFPEPTVARIPTPTVPPTMPTQQQYTDTRVIPILRQPTYYTPTIAMKAPASTQPPERHHNPKPFWWLPSSWEIDRNGEKPLLLRFWSRASPTSSSEPSTTTNFRENSRQPTDNLYREISAHEYYNVLGARNSRHHNTHEFT